MTSTKPIASRAPLSHGFFGELYLRQHMFADSLWTPSAVTEEFKLMSKLLYRRLVYKKLNAEATDKIYVNQSRLLRRQCLDGRAKLQISLFGSNEKEIRKLLINHKNMQRLYQRMPVYLVLDNINQRTFVMRKERDRLRWRLASLKNEYKAKLLERSRIESRIRFEDEFILEEENKIYEFHKEIENSNVRLHAYKAINAVYKKIIKVLNHDSTFYEPILKSLSEDIIDQQTFVKHVLALGMPAISKFKQLNIEYRKHEEIAWKKLQSKLRTISEFINNYKNEKLLKKKAEIADEKLKAKIQRKFADHVRETPSMLALHDALKIVEQTIKSVKCATLCLQARDIYPRIHNQMSHNINLHKSIMNNILGHMVLEQKEKMSSLMQEILIHNLSHEEIMRQQRIAELKELIAEEDKITEDHILHMKNRAEQFAAMRYTLWNVSSILRNVNRSVKLSQPKYPRSYLALPLLNFEMRTMKAYPPEIYEEDIDVLMHEVQRKLKTVMQSYSQLKEPNTNIEENADQYHAEIVAIMQVTETDSEEMPMLKEDLSDTKYGRNIPNRKQIKELSEKVVESFKNVD